MDGFWRSADVVLLNFTRGKGGIDLIPMYPEKIVTGWNPLNGREARGYVSIEDSFIPPCIIFYFSFILKFVVKSLSIVTYFFSTNEYLNVHLIDSKSPICSLIL
ncbi:hypothetical protein AMTRI_Chr02g257330 [Amborella trichopoda]